MIQFSNDCSTEVTLPFIFPVADNQKINETSGDVPVKTRRKYMNNKCENDDTVTLARAWHRLLLMKLYPTCAVQIPPFVTETRGRGASRAQSSDEAQDQSPSACLSVCVNLRWWKTRRLVKWVGLARVHWKPSKLGQSGGLSVVNEDWCLAHSSRPRPPGD